MGGLFQMENIDSLNAKGINGVQETNEVMA
jgi:hypothetical protein